MRLSQINFSHHWNALVVSKHCMKMYYSRDIAAKNLFNIFAVGQRVYSVPVLMVN
jgi:hypothetical protein